MKRRIISAALAVLMCAALVSTAFAVGSFSNFTKRRNYVTSIFSDIDENLWYGVNKQGVVKQVYELGIMSGDDKGNFNPTGELSVAEALKMACVVHSVYNGGSSVFNQNLGGPWYRVYVQYAVNNKIIPEAYTDDECVMPATMQQLAGYFYNCLPASELKAKNTISSIPDVPEDAENADEIYALYKAGVLTGMDEQGTLGLTSRATRAQAAAIIVRVAKPDQRVSLKL